MPVPFDTHAVIQQLEQLGFPTQQAEGLSQVLTHVVASSDYATTADIAAVRTDLKAEIAAVRADITETRLGLEVKIEALKGDLHKSFLGLMTPIYVGLLLMLLRAFWPQTP